MAVGFDFDSTLSVAVIGAGPVGRPPPRICWRTVRSRSTSRPAHLAGWNVLAWGHVRLFSPWRYMVDAAARELFTQAGDWSSPMPTSIPPAASSSRVSGAARRTPGYAIAAAPRSRVIQVTRDGFDKMKTRSSGGRAVRPDRAEPRWEAGAILAKAVIDASGTTATPNPLGAAGAPAIGERQLADRIFYGIPDVLGAHRVGSRAACPRRGQRPLRVQRAAGPGRPGGSAPGTTITWAIRRSGDRLHKLFGGGVNDALPARGALGARVQRLVETQRLHLVSGFKVGRLTETAEGSWSPVTTR